MDTDTRDQLREAARRRGHCPRCGNGHVRYVTDAEKQRSDSLFAELHYKQCPGCGHTWRVKTGPKS